MDAVVINEAAVHLQTLVSPDQIWGIMHFISPRYRKHNFHVGSVPFFFNHYKCSLHLKNLGSQVSLIIIAFPSGLGWFNVDISGSDLSETAQHQQRFLASQMWFCSSSYWSGFVDSRALCKCYGSFWFKKLGPICWEIGSFTLRLSISFLFLPEQMTTNLVTWNNTNLFYVLKVRSLHGSPWANIKVSAGSVPLWRLQGKISFLTHLGGWRYSVCRDRSSELLCPCWLSTESCSQLHEATHFL